MRKFYRVLLCFATCIVLLAACGVDGDNQKVETALRLSGDNRVELEKVLANYSQNVADTQKLRAAKFLIGNMPGHYSNTGDYIESYMNKIDSMYSGKDSLPHRVKKVLYNIPNNTPELRSKMKPVADITSLKADFLINHIDFCFDVWEKSPWLSELTYDNFEAYILPYNCANEVLDKRDMVYAEKYITSMQQMADKYEHLRYYVANYASFLQVGDFGIDSKFTSKKLEIPDDIIEFYSFDCLGSSLYNHYSYQLAGVPSAIDFVPDWGNSNGRHYWTAIIDQTSRHNNQGWIISYLTPKVYRRTYAHNDIPSKSKSKEDVIPSFFSNMFLKDVTNEYINSVDVNLNINTRPEHNPAYSYLGVFNSMSIKETAWSEVNGDVSKFKNMGTGIIYYPVYYNKQNQLSAGYPIYVNSVGEVKEMVVDTSKKHKIRIERKYPLTPMKVLWSHNLIGSRIEGSNDADFKNVDTLATIPYNPHLNYVNFYDIDQSKKYRYWRYVDAGKGSYVGEFAIYDLNNKKIKGKIISQPNDTTWMYRAFDEDVLTHNITRSWFGLDAGKPVSVSRIEHSPLSDDNGIVKGELYELLYYSLDGWVSMGKKTADDVFIEYDNVPVGGVYWLRNHTKGKEERPFTIEDGKQRFW